MVRLRDLDFRAVVGVRGVGVFFFYEIRIEGRGRYLGFDRDFWVEKASERLLIL